MRQQDHAAVGHHGLQGCESRRVVGASARHQLVQCLAMRRVYHDTLFARLDFEGGVYARLVVQPAPGRTNKAGHGAFADHVHHNCIRVAKLPGLLAQFSNGQSEIRLIGQGGAAECPVAGAD